MENYVDNIVFNTVVLSILAVAQQRSMPLHRNVLLYALCVGVLSRNFPISLCFNMVKTILDYKVISDMGCEDIKLHTLP